MVSGTKAQELMERVAQLGLRLDVESGINILRTTTPVDPEVIALVMEQVVTYLPEIRSILQKRAAAALGKKLAGRRLVSKEYGHGTLDSVEEDGGLIISIGLEARRSHEDTARISHQTVSSKAETLLIFDEAQASDSAPDDPASSQPPKRGILDRLRRA